MLGMKTEQELRAEFTERIAVAAYCHYGDRRQGFEDRIEQILREYTSVIDEGKVLKGNKQPERVNWNISGEGSAVDWY